MDIRQSTSFRQSIYENLTQYNRVGLNNYDYEKEGILKRCLPKIFFRPNGNVILISFLQLLDARFVLLIKYIDKLKRFKYIENY